MFNFFYNLSNIDFLAKIALFLSYEITYILIVSIIFWSLFRKRRKMYHFSLIVLAGFFSFFIANILKFSFKINRPFMEKDLLPLVFEAGYSFPSVHTSILFALSFVVYFLNKKIGVFLYIISLFIGLSRIVIGVHYPIDIFGGIVLGTFIGFIFVKIFKKI